MPRYKPEEYWPIDFYTKTQNTFHLLTKCILFEFSREQCQTKDLIIRNFVARADTIIKSISHLWKAEDYQDCWILYRCLMDRYFHLCSLRKRNDYDIFEAWSFYEQCKALNKVRSNQEFNISAKKSGMFSISDEHKERWRALCSIPPVWSRPKAEDIAKELGLDFLYDFGYDYASTHVHPMANDGDQDFYRTTGIKPAAEPPQQLAILSNSLLIGTLILQEALGSSSRAWVKAIHDSVSDIGTSLMTGSYDYEATFYKVAKMASGNIRLSGPRRIENR